MLTKWLISLVLVGMLGGVANAMCYAVVIDGVQDSSPDDTCLLKPDFMNHPGGGSDGCANGRPANCSKCVGGMPGPGLANTGGFCLQQFCAGASSCTNTSSAKGINLCIPTGATCGGGV
jgi:hypothetical protein